jgi:hypothetical protein
MKAYPREGHSMSDNKKIIGKMKEVIDNDRSKEEGAAAIYVGARLARTPPLSEGSLAAVFHDNALRK